MEVPRRNPQDAGENSQKNLGKSIENLLSCVLSEKSRGLNHLTRECDAQGGKSLRVEEF